MHKPKIGLFSPLQQTSSSTIIALLRITLAADLNLCHVQLPCYTPAQRNARPLLCAGMAADDLARAEAFMHIALSGASCKSEAGLKLLGDIKLAYHAAGTGLAQGTDESSIVHAVESIFSR